MSSMASTVIFFAALLGFALSLQSGSGPQTAVRVMQKTIFRSKCFGRGRAVRLCRKKRNGFCRAVRCSKENGNRGFRCRCRALPSPSPLPLLANKTCAMGKAKCPDGYVCSCGGRCRREVTLDIRAVGDDFLKIYTCGNQIGSTPGFDIPTRITYTGACDNIIVEATNEKREPSRSNPVAMSVLVEIDGKKFGTRSETDGVTALDAVGKFEPMANFEKNMMSFDYSDWTPVVVVDFLTRFPNIGMLDRLGARPVCTTPGSAAVGTYGFRIDAPYC